MIDERTIDELVTELAAMGNKVSFRVVSGSMSPLIIVGDRIVVDPIKPDHAVRVGDIVLFKMPNNTFLVHRVISRCTFNAKPYVRQKGDASLYSSRLPFDAIVGKVVAIQKGAKEIHITTPAWQRLNILLGLVVASFDIVVRGYRFLKYSVLPQGATKNLVAITERVIFRAQRLGVSAIIKGMMKFEQAHV